MKIRPICPAPKVTVDDLVQRFQKCQELTRVYHKARQDRNDHDAHVARLEIELYVPRGVYKLGGTQRHFAVYGAILQPSKKLLSPERLFMVPVIPIREARRHLEVVDDGSVSKWTTPLVDTGGFLAPIYSDGYTGERYTLVGHIVT